MNRKEASRKNPNLIMFDFDGVVQDSYEPYCETFRAGFFEVVGRPLSEEGFKQIFDTNMYDGMKEAGLDAESEERIYQYLRANMMESLEKVPPFPGVCELVLDLMAGHHLLIITSNVTVVVEPAARRFNLPPQIPIWAREDGASKVEKINRARKSHDHHRCFYVGDTAGDMDEGRRAGAETVGVTWGWHDGDRLRRGGADHVAHTVDDLRKIVSS